MANALLTETMLRRQLAGMLSNWTGRDLMEIYDNLICCLIERGGSFKLVASLEGKQADLPIRLSDLALSLDDFAEVFAPIARWPESVVRRDGSLGSVRRMKVVHNLIATTAKAIAQEAYEAIAHDNDFYAAWPQMQPFVDRNWQMFVGEARLALMQMLAVERWEDGQPVYKYPEEMREPVYQALLIDGSQRRDANAPKVRTRTASHALH